MPGTIDILWSIFNLPSFEQMQVVTQNTDAVLLSLKKNSDTQTFLVLLQTTFHADDADMFLYFSSNSK